MQKKVLLVEDVEDSRVMMRIMIEKHGDVSVIEAAGAYEAIEKAEEYQPDLILMDIGLPLLDGLSTATLIRRLKDLDNTPIIAVTGYRDILDQARKAGCSDVLYKPVEQPALAEMLSKHLKGH